MTDAVADRPGRGFWVAVGVGGLVMAWGAWLMYDAASAGGERVGFAVWIVLSDVLVDWVAIPVISLVGILVARFVPVRPSPPVQVGLILSGTVVLLAWLPLHDTAAATGNATIQPIDYQVAVGLTLGVIWLVVLAWSGVRHLVDQR